MVDTLFADVSYFQAPVDDSYPFRVLSIRANDGTFRDSNFSHNYQWCVQAVASGKLEFFIVYCYWRPNWEDTADTLIDMVNAEGGPHPRMVVMIDLESGGNPQGDQSDPVNRMYWRFAEWLGNPKRVIGYANHGDFTSMWCTRPDGLRMVAAGYGSDPQLEGEVAHQYSDGTGFGGGLPEGCPPFGPCDMNSADGLDPKAFAAACGIEEGAPVDAPTGNAINDAAARNPWLGDRLTSGENLTPDGRGRWAQFTHGWIYWTAETGPNAYVIKGAIWDMWAALKWETSPLGYPTTDEITAGPNVYQRFEHGTIYAFSGCALAADDHGTPIIPPPAPAPASGH